ncbi:MAG: glycosyltransferase [Flavobacteriales bacterium]|nr:glycosyltransferase [Flavobacteriales bacterium]MAU37328.1 glycosyltransferase [Flavobacteriales bacterium]|tara:strand:- start:8168 stop:9115 length:948 start_codon:yes stop_codon:yes gene_type:complete
MNISIVIPLFNEEESLPELCSWIDKVMKANNFSYEVLLIDDGSKDKSWSVVEKLSSDNKKIKGFKFRRNYGKSAALNVGFSKAVGDVVITMDADLQDSPDEIPDLYNKIVFEGYDLVSGWKKKRYDPITKTIPTKLFNWAARKFSGIYLHDFNCGLKSYRNNVVKSIEVHGEMHRYIPVLAKWAGFSKITEQVVKHQSRKYGVTKFGLERFFNGFLDLLTVTFVSRFGKKPMHFFGVFGTLMFILGFVLFAYIGGNKLYFMLNSLPASNIANMSGFYIALASMIIGVQLFLTGFIAEMISRNTYDRNNYHVEKEV